MNAFKRVMAIMAIGIAMLSAPATASAQEVPTGAARIIEKVQTRIFISKSTLVFKVEAILANQPTPGGE